MTYSQGEKAYQYCQDLFPICRSLTGDGVRSTLGYIKDIIPELVVHEVKTGEKAFDWQVPNEWNIRDAYIEDENGHKIIDFKQSNLHVVGYSTPINQRMIFEELDKHLYSLPEQPTAIPYIASYYKERWGFCLSEDQRNQLRKNQKKEYKVVIDSDLKPGVLNYGEVFIEGDSKQEVLISTYICHPSMANNELSGPAVAIELINWLKSLPKRRYSYRILFLVETLGALVYISRNHSHMQENIIAGYVLSCIGDNNNYTMIESRYGNTYTDKITTAVLKSKQPGYRHYTYLARGSDERQYCAPGIDLPVCTLCRTKFGDYPEYHTSLDNLDYISDKGLQGGIDIISACITLIEKNNIYRVNTYGEPQLGKKGLYPSLSTLATADIVRTRLDFLAYADGTNDILSLSDITGINPFELLDEADILLNAGVIDIV